jgi:serine/threonine-protein kinase
VVHRDVKPGNVLINKAGEVKVADFGIARAMTATSEENLTQTGSVMGTATYFSPEQAQGKSVDARSDLYSLGVVLYEMASGKPPFHADSPVAIAYKHVQEPIPSLVERVPTIPRDYQLVTEHALEKDPDLRYADAAAMRADLLRFCEGKPVLAGGPTAPGPARPPTPAPGPAAATASTAVAEAPPKNRNTAWFFVIIALLLVVLGGLLWVFGRQLGIFEEQKQQVDVPGVVGEDIIEATRQLEELGLVVETSDRESDQEPGTVLEQNPTAGTSITEGETVVLVVSTGIGEATLDDLVGLSEDEARRRLTEAGFTDVTTRTEESEDEEVGVVLRTEPGVGVYPKSEPIVLVISAAPAQTTTTTTAPPATTTAPPTTTTAPPTTTTAPPTTTTTAPTTTTTTPVTTTTTP